MSKKKNTNNSYLVELSNQIDLVLNNKLPSNNQIMIRRDTPKMLVDSGVKNLPMLITKKHIKSIIYTFEEAKKLDLITKDVVNYHGLGKKKFLKVLEELDYPKELYRTGENNYLLVTSLKDNEDNRIIVLIQANARGTYNNIYICENQIKSIYGKNNLNRYISKNNFKRL